MSHLVETGVSFTLNDSSLTSRQSGGTPWHQALPIADRPRWETFTGRISARAAAEIAFDWRITSKIAKIDDDVPVPGLQILTRSDTGAVLGWASDQYRIVQPADMAELIDRAMGETLSMESAVSLMDGKVLTLLAHLGDLPIVGEAHRQYILATAYTDGSGKANTYRLVNERVICNNTFQIAMSEDETEHDGRIVHRGSIRSQIREAGDLLSQAFGSVAKYQSLAERLVNMRLEATQRASLVREIATGDPADTDAGTRTENLIAEVIRLCSAGTGNENIGDTAYGVLQGVTDYVDHHRMLDSTLDRRIAYQTSGAGGKLKARALRVLGKLVA